MTTGPPMPVPSVFAKPITTSPWVKEDLAELKQSVDKVNDTLREFIGVKVTGENFRDETRREVGKLDKRVADLEAARLADAETRIKALEDRHNRLWGAVVKFLLAGGAGAGIVELAQALAR